jgi:hypothetical protein
VSHPLDADAVLAAARRPLVLGIGGGGDVVGALATAEAARLSGSAEPVLGGVAWERRPIDPKPGPRRSDEIAVAREIAPGVIGAGPDTRVAASGVLFAESRMAAFLGAETVLLDIHGGPLALAGGLAAAMRELGCDLAVFVDVGGDAIAHGDESELASPLCDAVLLAAAEHLRRSSGTPVLGAIFGPGCDGELTLDEVHARVAEIAAGGGLAGARGISPRVAERLGAAVEAVPTEASAQALRAYRGELGPTTIRAGRRSLVLSPAAALTIYFDVGVALRTAARLAAAVMDAPDLEAANDVLHDLGIRTELDYERTAPPPAPD